MKKLLFTILTMLLPMVASAEAVEINGIYYNLIKKAKVAEVTCKPNYNESEKYSGSVDIPESVTFEEETYTVTYIGKSAFISCSQLTSVVIPATVTYIMDYAFSGCSGLGAITIPNSVTTINAYAFQNCTGLTTISIPNSVKTLGEYAFDGCSSLTSAFIPNSIITIENFLFQNCSSLASIEIPNSVTSIGTGAFSSCTSFTSIAIPDNVTIIGSGAFSDCTNLTSVSLPTTLKSIEGTVFQNCSSLTSITIPNSVTYIGTSAFKGCTGLSSISIPEGVNTINKSAFQGCSSLVSISLPDNLSEITWGAFSGCTSLTEITLPESVTQIKANAFSGCSNLVTITIGGNVNNIANRAFASCSELKDFYCYAKSVPETSTDAFEDSYIEYATLHVLPASINAYKEVAPWKNFKEISGETSGSFGENVTFNYKAASQTLTISGTGAMTDYNNPKDAPCYRFKEDIKTIIIEEGVTHIGGCDFYEFVNLVSVSLPNSLTSIGSAAFANCTSLESITLPENVITIGDKVFSGCTSLSSISLPQGITKINYATFDGSGLKSISIPQGVVEIGESAFFGCDKLTSIDIPNNVKSIGFAAFSCSALTSVTLPNSVEELGSCAFKGCHDLSSVTLSENLTIIKESTFLDCNVEKISIPKDVAEIGGAAFSGCKKLREVTCLPVTAPLASKGAFDENQIPNVTLKVPQGSIDKYKDSEPWKNFKKIVAVESNVYILTYKVDGEIYKEYEYEAGETITPEPAPTKEGYAFSGWSEIPETMPAHDVTVTGSFTNNKPGGSCGANVKWEYDETNNTLVISGSGDMGIVISNDAPWEKLKEEIKHIIIEEGVTSISNGAFWNCKKAASLITPNSLKTVGQRSFKDCSSLTSVILGNSVETIGSDAFLNCSSLISVDIPHSVISIQPSAFQNCVSLTSINIGKGLKDVDGHVFLNCGNLEVIKVDENNPYYDSRQNCNAIIETSTNKLVRGCKSTTIPNSVITIGDGAFIGCKGLTSISIPESVVNFEKGAFYECSNLTAFVIPKSVTNISYNPFVGCVALKSLVVDNENPVYDSRQNCNAVIETSSNKLLFGCISSTIPSNIITIGAAALDGLSIESLIIPATVENIEEMAFSNNPSLKEIYCYSRTVPNTHSTAFDKTNHSAILYVPYSSINLYHKSSPWNSFERLALPITKEELLEKIEANINIMKSTEQSLQDAYNKTAKIENFESGQLSSFAEAVRLNIADYDAVIAKLESLKEKLNNGKTVTEEEIDNLKCEDLRTALLERLHAYEEYVITTSFASNEGGQIKVGNMNVKNETKNVSWFYSKAYIFDPHADVYKSVEISVVPSDGYHIKSIDIDGNDYTSKTSYTGDGFHAKNFTATFEQDTKPTYKLLYIIDGETYKSYDLEEGAPITPEAEPTMEGYTFSGWSEIPQTMPAKDVTVTGTFTINKYKLTYKVDGEVYKEYTIEYGATITPEPAPTKEGYTFSGWSDIPQTMPAKDVTVTGTFTKVAYKLIYKVDGEVYKTISYNYGDAITPEPAPTKEGYTFSGWNEIPQTMPAKDVTVTGTFTINKYKLTYKVDGDIYKEYELEYGATITPEPAPTKDGYEFSGWSEIPTTMPANNVEVTGTFKQIEYNVEDTKYEISGEGTVTIKGGDQKGNVEISGTVVINGQTYNVTAIAENAFTGNTQITSVTIPEGITSIGSNAFSGCVSLLVINVGKSVATIGNKAFANVGTSSSARTRGEGAFTVNCYAESVPQTASDAFENSPIATATLLVNDNIVDAYKTTSPWSHFGKIQGFQEAAGIDAISIDNPNAHIYDMQGKRIDNLQKGVNIIRLEDGKTKKVIVK